VEHSSGFAYGLQISPSLPKLVQCAGGIPIEYLTRSKDQELEATHIRFESEIDSARRVLIEETTQGTQFDYQAGQSFLWDQEARIVFDTSLPDVDRELRLATLYGPVLSWVSHCLGFLVLHGSAVRIDGRTIIFLAPRGGGKSTTVAYLNERGHQPISDDVCAIKKESGQWFVASGPTQFRLWEDSSELFQDTKPLYQGTSKKGKAWTGNTEAWHPIHKIYILQPEGVTQVRSETVVGAKKLASILSQSRVVNWLNHSEKSIHLSQISKLSNEIDLEYLYNRVGLNSLNLLATFLEQT
jgi:hypothetical protein